ncbi:MAG TPA: D-alanyl-D-alanine carboxypeptidase/D-alanyl-D-alanine-endopeptidase, partial [Bacteroidetes bacterium]|nr:D-alanyl-D-alanine carboxypeptidase/D-alanyl-D-alanine-endopeptidase [Bacteroidota bacterium]
RVLLDISGDKSLAPASNLKLFTSAAALDVLGPEHRFQTGLGYRGHLAGSVLRGDLVVTGGGDPTLGFARQKDWLDMGQVLRRWVVAVQKAGIRKVEGDLLADVSLYDPIQVPDGWLWMDIGNYYGAGPSALNFHENQYSLLFRPGRRPGDPAVLLGMEPPVAGLTFLNLMRTGPPGSGDNGYIYGGPGQFHRLLHGTLPAGPERFAIKGSLPDPPRFCLQALRDSLRAAGIEVSGELKVSYTPVAVARTLDLLESPPLAEIVYWLNKKSINLYAEVLLKHLGAAEFGEGSFEKGLEALQNYLQASGVPAGGIALFDGSGLSPLDAITTRAMTRLLTAVAQKPYFEVFYKSLPVAGIKDDSGHLSHLCRGTKAAGNLRAKTGLIERVRAHSGYVHAANGRLLAFSMIANDHTGKPGEIDRLHERIMVLLARLR